MHLMTGNYTSLAVYISVYLYDLKLIKTITFSNLQLQVYMGIVSAFERWKRSPKSLISNIYSTKILYIIFVFISFLIIYL